MHRSGEDLAADFWVMAMEDPDAPFINAIAIATLPPDWFRFHPYAVCQRIGGEWLQKWKSAVLRVPLVIIPNEQNYLLNPVHPNFSQISLLRTEPFAFNPGIKLEADS